MTRNRPPPLAGAPPRRGKVVQGDVVEPETVRRARPEAKFQKAVTDLLDLYRWRWHHEVDSRRSKRGLPDLIAVRRHRLIFAELKSGKGTVTEDQADWLYRLGGLGAVQVEVYVWRPSDMDVIERLLA